MRINCDMVTGVSKNTPSHRLAGENIHNMNQVLSWIDEPEDM